LYSLRNPPLGPAVGHMSQVLNLSLCFLN
jgi:hypothetical protein